jgi:hypothetical protein
MKTSELTGAALDWAVAKCEGPNSVAACYYDEDDLPMCRDEAPHMEWQPSTNWAQGGPIIEREKISTSIYTGLLQWIATMNAGKTIESGPTPLIAAMRCYVESILGDDVDLPEELEDEPETESGDDLAQFYGPSAR